MRRDEKINPLPNLPAPFPSRPRPRPHTPPGRENRKSKTENQSHQSIKITSANEAPFCSREDLRRRAGVLVLEVQ